MSEGMVTETSQFKIMGSDIDLQNRITDLAMDAGFAQWSGAIQGLGQHDLTIDFSKVSPSARQGFEQRLAAENIALIAD